MSCLFLPHACFFSLRMQALLLPKYRLALVLPHVHNAQICRTCSMSPISPRGFRRSCFCVAGKRIPCHSIPLSWLKRRVGFHKWLWWLGNSVRAEKLTISRLLIPRRPSPSKIREAYLDLEVAPVEPMLQLQQADHRYRHRTRGS